jgi:secreted trypsin-like serine protease
VLLTAAHCVLTEGGAPLANPTFRIFRGNDFNDANVEDWITIDPSNVHPHPGFKGAAHDIAVLVLDQPEDVRPLAVTLRPLTNADVGASVRLVGYGATVASSGDDDGFGVKRTLTTKIGGLEDGFVKVGGPGQTACGGDSGGPALMTIDGVETLIGVDSFSDAQPDCSAEEFYQRVDAEADFLAPFLGGTAPPPATKKDPKSGARPKAEGEAPSSEDESDLEEGLDGPAKTKTSSSSSGSKGQTLASPTLASCTAAPAAPGYGPAGWLALALGVGLGRRRRGFRIRYAGE